MSPTPFDPRPRALLFDLDGTLVDSSADLVASGNAIRAQNGLADLPAPLIASYIGDGVEALVRRLLERSEGAIAAEVESFMAHYRGHCLDQTRAYAQVESTLKALAARAYQMAVVTNKPEKVSRRILAGLGLAELFGSVVGGDTCSRKKPHPEPLHRACFELGALPGESLMIGDSRVDVDAGRAAGIPSVGLLNGIGDQDLLRASNPGTLLDSIEGLLDLL